MKDITISYDSCLIADHELLTLQKKLSDEIFQMKQAAQNEYEDDRASINLPFDTLYVSHIKELIKQKKSLKPTYLVVVGIGGSNLGTIAVQEAVFGKLYNQLDPVIKILYADTVDADTIHTILSLITPVLEKDGNVIVNVVSKSGGTTETIANFEVLLETLQKYKKNYEQYIIVTTDKKSSFWNLAHEKGFSVLEIPKKVGGRFSVFSAVGLFPLGLIDIPIDDLIEGAKLMQKQCLQEDIMKNPAAISAGLIYTHYLKGKNIHDLFLFSSDLESVGKWYRQLMAESLGKEYDRNETQVFKGITPTVSIGSTDLHSMAQLYLGGPYDKFTTFVSVENNHEVILPDYSEFNALVSNIQGISLAKIMQSILIGVQQAFIRLNRPFMQIHLPDKSASTIGQLLQFKMMEMMYLGALMNVNPFDQPNVEAYKIETRNILADTQIIFEDNQ